MTNTAPNVTITKPGVNRVLPTHELNGRRRRKGLPPSQSPEPKPQGPKPAARRGVDPNALGSFFSQFPPQAPLR